MAMASSRWMARGSSSSSTPNGGAAGPSIAPAAHRTEGAGIRGMRERAILIGAALQIEGRSGGGTDVRLLVPS
jgi:signal transduction histidine kinase